MLDEKAITESNNNVMTTAVITLTDKPVGVPMDYTPVALSVNVILLTTTQEY